MSIAASVLRNTAHTDFDRPITAQHASPKGLGQHLELLREFAMRLRYQHNEAVFSSGETAAHIYRVSAGCIRLTRRLGDGRRNISDFMLPGDIFGLGGFSHFPYTAEAVATATVVAYPALVFEQLCEGNAPLQADLMAHYTMLLARAQQHVFVTTCQTARERVASFILMMSERDQLAYGERIDLPMGRRDIADFLGLTVETICRALSSMKAAGTIAVPNAHQVSIIDVEALRALADGRTAQ